jgi:Icc-related predicted phosphoesterase
MKIVHISDTHGLHELSPEIWLNEIYATEKPDVIVHSGDFTGRNMKRYELSDFLKWFVALPFEHKILVPGNHDVWCEELEGNDPLRQATLPPGLHLLINESVEIDSVKFWGSPYTPWFYDWAFQLHNHEAGALWPTIPDDTDVLITHGPQHRVLDTSGKSSNPGNMGCKYLAETIKQLDIKAHLFGHIHGGYGFDDSNGYLSLNSASLNESYKVTNKPQVFELKNGKAKLC